MVRDYVSCLVQLHVEVRKLFSISLCEAREKYMAAHQRFQIVNGTAVEYAWLQTRDGVGRTSERNDFVTKFLELYDVLYACNSEVEDVRWRYASNATHEIAF